MASAIEIVDGRSVSFNEGAVEATASFILEGYANEFLVIRNGFGSSVTKIASGGLSTVDIPKIGSPHPLYPALLFCYAYDLTSLPGESDKWRVQFRYRRTPAQTSQAQINPVGEIIGTGPADIGFQELSARVSGTFVEAYRADVDLTGAGNNPGDIGGTPVDRAGVPTSVMRQQMEISMSETMSEFDPSDFVGYVGTRTKFRLFGVDSGYLVYRGANIQRIETNKFSVQHTWLYDSDYHLVQEPVYTIAGAPMLGTDGEFKGKASQVYHRQPFPQGDSHLLAPAFL